MRKLQLCRNFCLFREKHLGCAMFWLQRDTTAQQNESNQIFIIFLFILYNLIYFFINFLTVALQLHDHTEWKRGLQSLWPCAAHHTLRTLLGFKGGYFKYYEDTSHLHGNKETQVVENKYLYQYKGMISVIGLTWMIWNSLMLLNLIVWEEFMKVAAKHLSFLYVMSNKSF